MSIGVRYPSKKAMKEAIGQPLQYEETSAFGNEYKRDGDVDFVGPDIHHDRRYYGTVTMKDGKIFKVR